MEIGSVPTARVSPRGHPTSRLPTSAVTFGEKQWNVARRTPFYRESMGGQLGGQTKLASKTLEKQCLVTVYGGADALRFHLAQHPTDPNSSAPTIPAFLTPSVVGAPCPGRRRRHPAMRSAHRCMTGRRFSSRSSRA